jgi:hypothetical protein
MNEGEARARIQAKIEVTPQMVTIAKVGILKLCQSRNETESLIKKFLAEMGAEMPKGKLMLDASPEPLEILDRISNSVNWHVASSEAIWDLVNSGMLIAQAGGNTFEMTVVNFHIEWMDRAYGSSWSFEDYKIQVPRFVIKRLSKIVNENTHLFLSNHDLYIHNMNIHNADPEIISALREAIRCFRYELFLASVTMLGKASEGAWLELGASLVNAVNGQDRVVGRIKGILEDTQVGVNKKIDAVIQLYERRDLFPDFARNSGVNLQDLKDAALWSDAVRDSRNTIHFGNSPSIPNTYEKVAALILGATPVFRDIYQLKLVADTGKN